MERYMDARRTGDYMEPLLWIGGIVAAYFLWKKLSAGIGSVTAPVANAAADAWVAMTAGPGAVPTGNIILPGGKMVAVADVIPHAQSDGTTTVAVDGATYIIQPGTDANGNWTAVGG
jgi:hypothetical protein